MLKYLLEKEFKQIMRNKFIPKMIIAMPLLGSKSGSDEYPSYCG